MGAVSRLGGRAMPIEVQYVDPGNVVATCHTVLAVIAIAPPNPSLSLAMVGGARRLVDRFGCCGAYVLVDAEHGPPDETGRAVIQQIMTSMPKPCRGLALTFDGQGFVAAAKRSVTTLAILAARPPVPVKVFASATAATAWLFSRLRDDAPPGVRVADFIAVCDSLRAQLRSGTITRPNG